MKRKQKIPRRTRRQMPVTTDGFSNLGNPDQNQCKTQESSHQLPPNDFKDTTESPFQKLKVFAQSTIDSSSNLGECIVEQKAQDSEINVKECTENQKQLSRQHVNTSENFSALKRSSRTHVDNLVQSVLVRKKPKSFINLTNGSVEGVMPVILDVFTLSKVPASQSNQKTTNQIQENGFPVTPPCSPPLGKPEHFTSSQTVAKGFQRKIKTTFPTNNGFTMPTLDTTTNQANMYNIYSPGQQVSHNREQMASGIPSVFPTPINQLVNQRMNYSLQDQSYIKARQHTATRYYENANYSDKPSFSVESDMNHTESNLALTEGFVSQGRKLYPRSYLQNEFGIITENRTSNHCAFPKLLQNVHKEHFPAKISNKENQELKNIDRARLNSLSSFTKLEHCQSDVSPETAFPSKTSYTPAQSVSDQENPVNNSDVLLSPQDIKVLELKKRLKEQEEALKKLCTNHWW